MLKRLLDTVREYPLLKLLLFFHGMAIAILAALYYMRVDAVLWGSILAVPVVKDADGNWVYQHIAGGPFVMLPWNLLPQHVLWVALDVLITGSLTIWWGWWAVGDELRRQVAGARVRGGEARDGDAGNRGREGRGGEEDERSADAAQDGRQRVAQGSQEVAWRLLSGCTSGGPPPSSCWRGAVQLPSSWSSTVSRFRMTFGTEIG